MPDTLVTSTSCSPAKEILVLGATGSIGRQTLDFVEKANEKATGLGLPRPYRIAGLYARADASGLARLAARHPGAKTALAEPEVEGQADFQGQDALASLLSATQADIAVNGVSGASGLPVSVAVLEAGLDLALANKESIVMGWPLLRDLAKKTKGTILPVDSEHSALFQLISRIGKKSVVEIGITASGGPFRDWSIEQLSSVGPDAAAAHPVWKMGRKISIDSASLANKGLELIEAAFLFEMDERDIRVLVHPQSLVHAFARTIDGALFAHCSPPDMRIPIGLALSWPCQEPLPFPGLDLAGKRLEFFDPDSRRFPMIELARNALRAGGAASIVYNAANEAAVCAFESGRIGFLDIPRVVDSVLSKGWNYPTPDLLSIFQVDAEARALANRSVSEKLW
ncbi:MAG TPA: 1-deoxy-D-xylulose-5-phosphate reductoisomerase [Rectinemataceae bacterium]